MASLDAGRRRGCCTHLSHSAQKGCNLLTLQRRRRTLPSTRIRDRGRIRTERLRALLINEFDKRDTDLLNVFEDDDYEDPQLARLAHGTRRCLVTASAR